MTFLFIRKAGGTKLVQRETVYPRGLLKLVSPFIKLMLGSAFESRLKSIKRILEAGWTPY